MSCVEVCRMQCGLNLNAEAEWNYESCVRCTRSETCWGHGGRKGNIDLSRGSNLVRRPSRFELNRRVGAAEHAIWLHAALSRDRKVKIFSACIASKLC
eukprot:5985035-Pyramimonas_sp.AAC.1